MSLTTKDYQRIARPNGLSVDGAPVPKKKCRELRPLPPLELFINATRNHRELKCDGWNRFVLPYPPSVNEMYGLGVHGKRAIKFLDKEGKRYQKAVADIALAVGSHPLIGRVQVLLDVYRPQASGDLDNTFKAVLDSVKGIAWIDDSQIRGICANQHEDRDFPRVALAVRLAPGETMNFHEFLGRTHEQHS